ncbi:serine threonine- kinase endoribonuclease IRE1-like, partial [Paramuricea clavata]
MAESSNINTGRSKSRPKKAITRTNSDEPHGRSDSEPRGHGRSKSFTAPLTRSMSLNFEYDGVPLKYKYWKTVSVKHRKKFERLSEVWEKAEGNPELINDNCVCFKEEFLIGKGSSGTEVYVCLGSDGIERAIKRLPKVLCNLLKNERDILTSSNAVESPRVVYYYFYDDTSSPDFGYLILNLYEKNLEEFVKEEGEKITKSRTRKMIRQVLEGLKALHAREPRILHRDLKPTNILVDVKGDLALSDFGIGRFFSEQ